MSTEVRAAVAGSSSAMLGMKVFVASDVATFGALITASIVLTPSEVPRLVSVGQGIGLTGFLAAVSLSLILAARGKESSSHSAPHPRIMCSVAVGTSVAFLLLAVREARTLLAAGVDPRDSIEAGLFFAISGFHAAHVAAGVALLGLAIHRPARLGPIALYWHFVDLIWVALFLRFYV